MSKSPIPAPIIDSLEYFNQDNCRHKQNYNFAPMDYSIVIESLKQYGGNKATFESYRREIASLDPYNTKLLN